MPKKYQVKIQEEVVDELDHLYQFIFQDKPLAAKKFVQNLRNKILDLKTFPKRGTLCRLPGCWGVFTELRYISYCGYLIFYEVMETEVIILHVTAPGQDWISLFL